MSIKIMTMVWETDLQTTRKMVLLALADNANDQGECYPSVPKLAAKCNLSDRSIQIITAELERDGYLEREMREGRSTLYRITPDQWPTNPRSTFTPEIDSPPKHVHPTPEGGSPPPPKEIHPTPEGDSPRTVNEPSGEPSLNPNSSSAGADDSAGGDDLFGKPPASATPNCPHEEIIAAYHEILPMLPAVREWTRERQRLLAGRWKENPRRQDLGWWRKYFEYVAESDFLCGRTGKFHGANLEWLIRPRNMVKVIEGNYENRERAA